MLPPPQTLLDEIPVRGIEHLYEVSKFTLLDQPPTLFPITEKSCKRSNSTARPAFSSSTRERQMGFLGLSSKGASNESFCEGLNSSIGVCCAIIEERENRYGGPNRRNDSQNGNPGRFTRKRKEGKRKDMDKM